MGARYLYGDIGVVLDVDVDSAVAIEIGDLVYLSSGKAIPAASVTWDTDTATTQTAAHDIQLGVALTAHAANSGASTVRIATGGVWEFDCAAATFAIGDVVGPAKASGNNLENQKVVASSTAARACGRVVKHYGSNTTKVPVLITSIVHGGVLALA